MSAPDNELQAALRETLQQRLSAEDLEAVLRSFSGRGPWGLEKWSVKYPTRGPMKGLRVVTATFVTPARNDPK